MDIERLADKIDALSKQYTTRFNIDRNPDWIMLKLNEEAGELTQAYLRHSGQTRNGINSDFEGRRALEDEIADLLGMTLVMARHFELDLIDGLNRKWLTHESANAAAIAMQTSET